MTEATTRTVEEEMQALDGEIESMERELAEEAAPPLRWEEITSSTADELARKEQRRGILPRLITAAKIKRLELQRESYERQLEPLISERDEAHRKLEKARDKERKAKEEREAAHGLWGIKHGAVQSLEDRVKRTNRELRELKEGA